MTTEERMLEMLHHIGNALYILEGTILIVGGLLVFTIIAKSK